MFPTRVLPSGAELTFVPEGPTAVLVQALFSDGSEARYRLVQTAGASGLVVEPVDKDPDEVPALEWIEAVRVSRGEASRILAGPLV